MPDLKFSIVTVVFNNESYISDCLDSVSNQKYPNYEHIIIDGASTDGTLDIIKNHENGNTKVISEPDYGLYDAMNKGVQQSNGDIIGFLNSDDMLHDNSILETIVKVFSDNEIDSCYGDLVYVDKDDTDKVIRYWRTGEYNGNAFRKGWHPPHPTFYVKRSVFEKYGLFDTGYTIASDYALMLKLLEKERISTYYIPKVLVKMRVGGVSNTNLLNIFKANIECYRAWKDNGLNISPMILFRKPFSKILQYVRKEKF